MATYNRDPALLEKVSLRRGHPSRILSDSLQVVTRAYVRKANEEGTYITLETLFEYLKQASSEAHPYVLERRGAGRWVGLSDCGRDPTRRPTFTSVE